MSEQKSCDRCAAPIEKGDGYAFYSSATMGMFGDSSNETGNMLICKTCADEVTSDENFSKRFEAVAISDENIDQIDMIIRQSNDAGIAERCNTLGLSPRDAREKARELAQLFWQDADAGDKKIREFWTSGKAHPQAYKIPWIAVTFLTLGVLGFIFAITRLVYLFNHQNEFPVGSFRRSGLLELTTILFSGFAVAFSVRSLSKWWRSYRGSFNKNSY